MSRLQITRVVDPTFEPAEWGYKGFVITPPGRPIIRIVSSHEAKHAYIYVGDRPGALIDTDRAIETWLFQHSSGVVERLGMSFEERRMPRIASLISGFATEQVAIGDLECENGVSFPGGNTAAWNASNSNCYNYANDVMATGVNPAVPGPNGTSSWTKAQMIHAATVKDKLTLITPEGELPRVCPASAKSHYLGIFLRDPEGNGSFTDFHCLRLDRDGMWSHKDGSSNVSRKDHSTPRKVIRDLRTAVFKPRMTLVGFFVSTKGVRRIS